MVVSFYYTELLYRTPRHLPAISQPSPKQHLKATCRQVAFVFGELDN